MAFFVNVFAAPLLIKPAMSVIARPRCFFEKAFSSWSGELLAMAALPQRSAHVRAARIWLTIANFCRGFIIGPHDGLQAGLQEPVFGREMEVADWLK